MPTLGIENVKPALRAAAQIRNITADALSDGKFTAIEAFGYVPVLSQMPAIIQSGPTILAELKDASHPEREELEQFAKDELNIPSEEVEEFIGDALDWAISTINIITKGSKLFGKTGE